MGISLNSNIPTATAYVSSASGASASGASGASASSGVTATAAVTTTKEVVMYTAQAPGTGGVTTTSGLTTTGGVTNTNGVTSSVGASDYERKLSDQIVEWELKMHEDLLNKDPGTRLTREFEFTYCGITTKVTMIGTVERLGEDSSFGYIDITYSTERIQPQTN